MAKYLLVTRPEHDYSTRYLSAWAKRFFALTKKKGYSVIDLYRQRANRREIESILDKKSPDLVVINGHGNSDSVAGHKNEPLLIAGDNSFLLKEKIIYAISCRSAAGLGKEAGEYTNTAYIGYKEDFVFVYLEEYRTRPLEDKLAALFLDPSNLVVTTLLKGHPTQDAVSRAKQEFLRKIQTLLTSEARADEYSTLRYLVWDMKNLVLCGKADKKLF